MSNHPSIHAFTNPPARPVETSAQPQRQKSSSLLKHPSLNHSLNHPITRARCPNNGNVYYHSDISRYIHGKEGRKTGHRDSIANSIFPPSIHPFRPREPLKSNTHPIIQSPTPSTQPTQNIRITSTHDTTHRDIPYHSHRRLTQEVGTKSHI